MYAQVHRMLLVFLLLLNFHTGCTSRDEKKITKDKICGLYGVYRQQQPFRNKSNSEIAQLLKSWGVNAVWGFSKERDLILTLQEHDIKVFATVGAFMWTGNKDELVITKDGTPLKRYPEGHPGNWYMGNCPNGPEALKRLYRLIEEGMKSGVNGIWLDAIRFACYWEWAHPEPIQNCFCPRCLERFQKDTGIKLPLQRETKEIAQWILKDHEKAWAKWKSNLILDICRRCRKIVKKHNPDAILGIFCVPWRDEDFDGAITKVLGQDYDILGEDVDVFSPMVYHRMCNRPVSWITETVTYISDKSGKPVWPIVQSLNDHEGIMSNEEFLKVLKAGLKEKSSGVTIFKFDRVIEHNRLDVMARLFTGILSEEKK